ncbi:MAG: class I SAM-dependent methyltransferase [Rhodospirillales bacterium]|nr:class I SAM-dependent methyltransferase [Rhodospirillales bacterium]
MTGDPAGQRWDPQAYAAHARFVSELGQPLVDLLAPRAGERLLDLGCGDGALTERLAALGCAVVGVDASPEQVAAARSRGLDARVMDGERLAFKAEFDAVFSNAALHWMTDADAVLAGIHRALKAGGRFVGEMGGQGNIARIAEALTRGLRRRRLPRELPWYFPSAEEYRAKLQAAGFAVAEIVLFPRPTPLPGDIAAWLEIFASALLARLPADQRPDFIAELREALRPHLQQPDGSWVADYVRLRFRAVKPG